MRPSCVTLSLVVVAGVADQLAEAAAPRLDSLWRAALLGNSTA
ncbi:hypothetical protein AB0C29_24285 [Actinoplanes sp. NPDC048791]